MTEQETDVSKASLGTLGCRLAVIEDTANVVKIAGQYDSLGAEPGGRELGDKAVADRSDSEIVDEGEDEETRSDSPCDTAVLFGVSKAETADHDKKDDHGDHAPEVECTTTESAHGKPGEDGADGAEGVLDHGHIEGALGRETGLFWCAEI